MEMLAVAVVALVVAGPIVALVLAIGASARARRLEEELRELKGRVTVLSRALRDAGDRPAPPGTPLEPNAAEAGPPPLPESLPLPPGPAHPTPAGTKPPGAGHPAGAAPSRPLPAARPSPPESSAAAGRPTAGMDLERLLGGSLLVWIGGVALALAAAFLVKYSLEQGWIGPGTRIALGLSFGLVLIGAGEWLRPRSARVAQSACAAGVAALFASLLAGTNLYLLIPPVLGFLGLALTAAAAVALSLRHGAFVAGLGLLGGFVTPALIRTGEPNAPMLFGYLLALQLGLLQVARRRGWWPLGLLTLVGTQLWATVWLVGRPTGPHEPWLGLFVLAATAAALLACFGEESRGLWGEVRGHAVAPLIGWTGGVLGLLVLGASVSVSAFSNMEWGFLAVLAAGGLVLAFLDEGYLPLPWLTAGAGAVLLLAWSREGFPFPGRFLAILTAYGALHALGAWLAGRRSPATTAWSSLSAAATLAFFLVGWQALPEPATPGAWGVVALALAALHAGAFALRLREPEGRAAADGSLAAHAVAATALLSLAAAIELRNEWIAVALALELPLLAWLHERLRVPALRTLGGAVGLLAAALLLLNPAVFDYPMGELPVLDWLLWGYGLPCAAFALAALLFRRLSDDGLVAGLEWGACAFAAAWLALELRKLFHGGELDASAWTLAEQGWIAGGWLLLGGLLAEGGRRRERPAVLAAGCAIAVLGLAVALLGPLLGRNPLWSASEVAGARIVNTLLIAYLLPALLASAWAIALRRHGRRDAAPWPAAAALALGFALVTLEVRHWFHHPRLDGGTVGSLELYAYSAAWILMGVALLAGGLRLGSKPLRQAALGVMLVTVAKVFLLDMRELEDLWRVLSFFGLGVSLLALGYLYQRFVLREA